MCDSTLQVAAGQLTPPASASSSALHRHQVLDRSKGYQGFHSPNRNPCWFASYSDDFNPLRLQGSVLGQ